jgi:DNA-binding MarR family transcriptional regulator
MSTTTTLGTTEVVDLSDIEDLPSSRSTGVDLVDRLTVTAGLLMHRLEGLLRDSGLTTGSYNVLQVIAASPEPLTPSEISVGMPVPVTTATMTGVLDTLERRGFVVRRPHPTDRRRVLIELCAEGRELLESTVPHVQDMQSSWVGPLSREEGEELVGALGRLEDRLRTVA